MSERMNGKKATFRRNHGSERRGVTPVPDLNFAVQQRQSREDKEKVLAFMREQRERLLGLGNRDLPAFKHKDELVANIEAHKAVIVGGETGSGKSTQLPQFLYEAGYDMTIMLVPRRVIADGLGERIREEMSSQIDGFNADETIGIVHGERVERHENNKILVMTPNTFIKMKDELQEKFAGKKLAIVADEIHEANLFTEIAVGVAALAVQSEDDWRLVAASATHNSDTLQKPFQKLNGGYVPSVEIKGRPFNVELREEPELNPMQAYARDGFEHEKSMIFTSGKNEIKHIIEETRRELDALEKNSSERVIFRMLHGELTETELAHINDPVPEGYRLVIVSSPAGMSGITIPGVTYVATDGTINRSELDDDNADGLRRRLLSKAGITQQIGRAGRDVPGGIGVLCAPVNTRRKMQLSKQGVKGQPQRRQQEEEPVGMEYEPFASREAHEPPEIYNTNLSRIVLSVAALRYDFADINEYIPHPVKSIDIINAELALTRLGALDEGKVTELGLMMDAFPIKPELARGLYEASLPGRSLQHMARAAFIAAAVDVGGLQDHKAEEEAVKLRKQIIRSTSTDDLMSELDLMTKLFERTDEEWSGHGFVERHGLHPKRVERVRKASRKILKTMGIRLENITVTAPLPDEEQLLRDDFTAGFIDYTHEDVGTAPRSKSVLYRNIHGHSASTTRTISDRSMSKIERGQLVAGIPRYYYKGRRKDGTEIKHDIIDHVFPVDPSVIGRYAMQNGLVQGERRDSRMDGDRVVEYQQGMFGSIVVGAPMPASEHIMLSEQTQNVLVAHVLRRPGRTQRALRELAEDLEDFRTRTPAAVLRELRKQDAPEDLTQDAVTDMIKSAVKMTDMAHGVEEELARESYSSNITLARYYDVESITMLNKLSPKQLVIANEPTLIRYEDAQPYVTNMPRRRLNRVNAPIFLEDGREVLYQREIPGGGKERVSFGSFATSLQ